MILVLNLMGYASSASRRHPKPHSEDSEEDTADWQLVDSTTELIRSTTHEIGGKVSEQCIRCIELFASCHKYPGSVEEMKGETAKVVVPFFGTLVLAPGKRFDSQDMTKVASSLPTPPTNNSASASDYSGQSPLPFSSNEPFIGFDSYNNPLSNDFFGNGMVNLMDPPMDPMQRGSGSNVPAAMGSWPDTSMLSMDLDHDWSWYMSGGMNPTNMPK